MCLLSVRVHVPHAFEDGGLLFVLGLLGPDVALTFEDVPEVSLPDGWMWCEPCCKGSDLLVDVIGDMPRLNFKPTKALRRDNSHLEPVREQRRAQIRLLPAVEKESSLETCEAEGNQQQTRWTYEHLHCTSCPLCWS